MASILFTTTLFLTFYTIKVLPKVGHPIFPSVRVLVAACIINQGPQEYGAVSAQVLELKLRQGVNCITYGEITMQNIQLEVISDVFSFHN